MRKLLLLLGLAAAAHSAALALDVEPLVRDASFLIGESWSPAPGLTRKVSFVDFLDEATDYEFSADYAVSEGHTFAVTVPVSRMADFSDEPSHEHFGRSVGDLQLTYGTEFDAGSKAIFRPSVSVFLPTGDVDEGYGEGRHGALVHLPLSVRLGARTTAYSNTELTFYRGVTDLRFVQRVSYLATHSVNLQLEALYLSGTLTEEQAYLCPGIRWTTATVNGIRFEQGVALPIGLTHEDDYRAMVYLSVIVP